MWREREKTGFSSVCSLHTSEETTSCKTVKRWLVLTDLIKWRYHLILGERRKSTLAVQYLLPCWFQYSLILAGVYTGVAQPFVRSSVPDFKVYFFRTYVILFWMHVNSSCKNIRILWFIFLVNSCDVFGSDACIKLSHLCTIYFDHN